MAGEGGEGLPQPDLSPESAQSPSEAVAPPTSPNQERNSILSKLTDRLTRIFSKKTEQPNQEVIATSPVASPEDPQRVRDQMGALHAEKLNMTKGNTNMPDSTGSGQIDNTGKITQIDAQLEALKSKLPEDQITNQIDQTTSPPSPIVEAPASADTDGKAA